MMGSGGRMMGSGQDDGRRGLRRAPHDDGHRRRDLGTGGNAGADGGAACREPGTIAVTNSGMTAYVMDGASDPMLTLMPRQHLHLRGNSPGHPFYIKTVQETGTGNAYSTGVTGNGATSGNRGLHGAGSRARYPLLHLFDPCRDDRHDPHRGLRSPAGPRQQSIAALPRGGAHRGGLGRVLAGGLGGHAGALDQSARASGAIRGTTAPHPSPGGGA